MVTALVTRPRDDAVALAAELERRGLSVVVEPLLDIVALDDVAIDCVGVQGILATSANGVRALAARLPDRFLPVWAVGDASARVARELGYVRVESAGGDVDDLAALVAGACRPADGAFLHAAGTVTAGDLAGRLEQAGFQVRRVVLYQARPAKRLSDALCRSLASGGIDLALFFSPRTAATFATLVADAGGGNDLAGVTAYALSPAVARELAALPWSAVRVAQAPTQAALLAALDHDLQRDTSMTDSEKPTDDREPGAAALPPVAAEDDKVQERPAAAAAQPAPAGESLSEPAPAGESQSKPAPAGGAEPKTAAAARKSAPWLALGLSLAAIAVVGGAMATFDQWKGLVLPTKVAPVQMAAPPQASAVPAPAFRPATDTEALRVELAALRERLARLESQPAGGDPVVSGRLDKAEGAIAALQAQPQLPAGLVGDVAELGKQVADLKRTSADAAAVLRLSDRIDKAEAELREVQARRSSAVAVLLAVGQLREALARAMPFDDELRALLALAGTDPEVVTLTQPLKARSLVGIPTQATLVGRFHRLAPDLVRAQVLPAEQSWWRQTLDRLAALVVVRREDGEAAGTGAAAIVARVEARLAEDDLEHAVAEAQGFGDAAAEIAAPWLADAQARLAAESAASALTAHVVAQVGARP